MIWGGAGKRWGLGKVQNRFCKWEAQSAEGIYCRAGKRGIWGNGSGLVEGECSSQTIESAGLLN